MCEMCACLCVCLCVFVCVCVCVCVGGCVCGYGCGCMWSACVLYVRLVGDGFGPIPWREFDLMISENFLYGLYPPGCRKHINFGYYNWNE